MGDVSRRAGGGRHSVVVRGRWCAGLRCRSGWHRHSDRLRTGYCLVQRGTKGRIVGIALPVPGLCAEYHSGSPFYHWRVGAADVRVGGDGD